EHGDQGGQAHHGQGGGNAGDVAAPGGQGKGAAGHRRGALRPLLPGGEQGHGRARGAAQQGEGEAAAAGPGGAGGFGTGVRYSSHALHYRANPGRCVTRGSAQGVPSRFAVCTARSTAAALLRHSVSSATGSESATIPAPACT